MVELHLLTYCRSQLHLKKHWAIIFRGHYRLWHIKPFVGLIWTPSPLWITLRETLPSEKIFDMIMMGCVRWKQYGVNTVILFQHWCIRGEEAVIISLWANRDNDNWPIIRLIWVLSHTSMMHSSFEQSSSKYFLSFN